MENKFEFLARYHKNIKSITTIDEINNYLIPNEWYKAFSATNIREKINIILSVWKKYCGIELSNTISYLNENIVDIDFVEYDEKISIIYSIKTSEGEMEYYEGRNPNENFNNSKLEEVWSKIPESLPNFYENVHNGFYYYASEGMGLVPFESVTYFDDYEWGIIEDLEEPLQIDLKTTFGFFKSGAGGYVAIDYESGNNNIGTLWFSNDQPEYNIDFWDVVDEWMVIGFE